MLTIGRRGAETVCRELFNTETSVLRWAAGDINCLDHTSLNGRLQLRDAMLGSAVGKAQWQFGVSGAHHQSSQKFVLFLCQALRDRSFSTTLTSETIHFEELKYWNT